MCIRMERAVEISVHPSGPGARHRQLAQRVKERFAMLALSQRVHIENVNDNTIDICLHRHPMRCPKMLEVLKVGLYRIDNSQVRVAEDRDTTTSVRCRGPPRGQMVSPRLIKPHRQQENSWRSEIFSSLACVSYSRARPTAAYSTWAWKWRSQASGRPRRLSNPMAF